MSENADLLFSAAFDDQTKQFFDMFDRRMQGLGDTSGKAFDETAKGADQSAAAIGLVAGAVAGLTVKLAEMAIQAALAFPQMIAESTQIAAQAEVTGTALLALAERSGISAQEVETLRDKMVEMTFAEDTANEVLLRLIGSEIDLAGVLDLANASLDTATVLGKAEEDVIQRLVLSIVTQNTRIARNLQLKVQAADVDREAIALAKAQGIAIGDVNREQARFNATLKAAEKFQGAYASASELAGIEAEEMPSKIRELQKEFGNLFVPAYLEFLVFMREHIQSLTEWFKENEEAVKATAEQLRFLVSEALEFATATIKIATNLRGMLKALVPIFNLMENTLPDMDERWAGLGTTAKQALAFIAAGVSGLAHALIGVVKTLTLVTKSFIDLGTAATFFQQGRFLEGKDALVKGMLEFNDAVGTAFDTFENAGTKAEETFIKWSTGLGLIEGDTEAVADETQKLADDVDELGAALEDAAEKIAALNEAFAEELAKVGIQRMRQDIDRAIREARRREDIERNHQENIAKIIKNAKRDRQQIIQDGNAEEKELETDLFQERADLAERHTQTLLDIEKNYRRQLEDIRADFEFNQAELLRKNDAVGLLRLMRQTKKQMQEARTGRDRRVEDARASQAQELEELQVHQATRRAEIQRDTAERLAEFDADLKERLRLAEDQRLKNIESLERSLSREQEDIIRHRAWQDEDRIRAHQKELEALGQHFAGVEGLTAAHLQRLLEEHGSAIQGLDILWSAFRARQAERAVASTASGAAQFNPTSTTWSGQNQELQDWFGQGGGSGEWGLQRGGFGIAQRETNVKLAEGGQAEAFAALPLNGTVNHRLSGRASVDVNGVGDQGTQLSAELYDALVDIFRGAKRAA